MKTLSTVVLALIVAGCGSSQQPSAVESGRFGPVPNFSMGDPDDTDGDDDDDDDTGDDDDDGGETVPCEGFELLVTNQGVSSAHVWLNGAEVVPPSAFPTVDEIAIGFTANSGDNVIGARLTGSPGDVLEIRVLGPDGTTLLHATILRSTGKPELVEIPLTIACD